MTGIHWKKLLDRTLLAVVMIGAGVFANQVAPQLPAPPCMKTRSHSIDRATELQTRNQWPRDTFVPLVPNEPMESLEN